MKAKIISTLRSRILNPAVTLLLFVSGAAGLVYEIVWARYLALFLGHTSYAVMMVLAAFMGGIAAGSYWLGKRADRTRQLLKFYGLLEIGIAIYGLVFPWYFSICRSGFTSLAASLQPNDTVRIALQLAFSVVTILLPTVLMGGTLPVLARFMTRSVAEVRGRVAALYAINSAGAVAGCILADFWLIPDAGLSATVQWAVGMNLFAGLGALALDRWLLPTVAAPASKASQSSTTERFSAADKNLALIGIGASGFVAMLYEVGWTRLLALVMGSSTHAFSIMLTTFIAGIAAGAWLLSRWKSPRRTLDVFAWLEIAVAVSVLVSMFAYSYLPYWFASLANQLVRSEEKYPLYELIQGLTCFGVAFVPTVCLGMTLPLASRILTQEVSGTGGAVGRVFAVNTLGTVLGAVVSGLILMPWLGLARTFALGAAINAAIGLAILARKHRARQLIMGASLLLVTMGFTWSGVPWFDHWPQRLIMGLWRKETLPASRKDFEESADTYALRFYQDGAGSTVSVNSFIDGFGRPNLSLRVNGKPDAGTSADMPTQLLLGHMPMLLHPESRQALVIGLGSGVTCGAIATHPSIRRLDVVEISPEVVKASGEFAEYNGNVLADPRVHLAVEDAKSFLQITPVIYDVIVSEPSNPWVAGVAGVFSQEFYQSCQARLSPGGLMTQWVQLYETSDEAVDIVLRTFTSVFPQTGVWRVHDDLILVGSAQPIAVSLDSVESRFNIPVVKRDLGRIENSNIALLLAGEIISPEYTAFVPVVGGPRQSDVFPVLEYVAQRAFFARAKPTRWSYFDETQSPRTTTLLGRYLKTHEPTIEDVRAFVKCFVIYRYPSPRIIHSLIYRWQQTHPDDREAMELSSRLPPRESNVDSEIQRLSAMRDTLWASAASDPKPLSLYRSLLWKSYIDRSSAFCVPPSGELQAVLGRLLETDSTNQRIYKLELARLAWDRGQDVDCIRLALNALDGTAQGNVNFDLDADLVPEMISRLAELARREGGTQQALNLCKLAFDAGYVNPRLEMVQRKLLASPLALARGMGP